MQQEFQKQNQSVSQQPLQKSTITASQTPQPQSPQQQKIQQAKKVLPVPGFSEEPIEAPLVFQCSECLIIVGDSFAWVSADQDLSSIVLFGWFPKELFAKPKNLRVGDDLFWSKEGVDVGSTFKMTYCSGCNKPIGKVYHTTPRQFDYLRDFYTVKLENVAIYQLGTYIKGEKIPPDMITFPSSKSLQSSIDMVKDVILVLNDRLSKMDERLLKIEKYFSKKPTKKSQSESSGVSESTLSPESNIK
ncbi:10374_t:CDS:2 [Ambispora gerdemannii]|uniref:10374_t:CDS:1 n=1 Tax=Ambispora gerdemannii TaxID=144530 RepID=A0A9N8ZNI0_9GLOM|nr:10374_t:CDS:2 [Ambispora gerdemannii]